MRHGCWYNIFLPRQYNDGRDIEQRKFDITSLELVEQYGSFTQLAFAMFSAAPFFFVKWQIIRVNRCPRRRRTELFGVYVSCSKRSKAEEVKLDE